ncbi:MAG TPA: elongation factor G [Oleiagrimonas sp.]|nr:elongation factor G [Oleiagrimonas sp.]
MSHADRIRNIALTGHAGAGKTTLFEALLHAGGALPVAGDVEHGNTVSDFDPQEQEHGHSIDTAIAAIERPDSHINLIDTAGYADFRGPTLATLNAVETVAVVVNAANGIERGTRRLMHYAGQRGLARLLVVNRIDMDGLDLATLVADLQEAFGNECLPVNLPAADGDTVLDCFFHTEGQPVFSSLADAHQRILDQVVEIDESVMAHYLDTGEEALGRQELHDAFEQCLREGHLVPICFVSARTGTGVAELLELAERLLPSPAERNPPPFMRGHGKDATPVNAKPDADRHVIANVFKIINDPFVGKLGVFRIHQGTLRRNAQVYINDGRKAFKVGHLLAIQGKEHHEIKSAGPGDLAAIGKVDDIHYNAVLHDSHDEDAITLAPLEFPHPMFGLAVEPAHKGQEQKLSEAMTKLSEEDPCLRIEHHRELNETVLRGLGELHLKVMLERMSARYGVNVDTRPPRIAYRETISASAEGHYRLKKQTGGAGQFGEVFLRVEPLPRGDGFEFVDAVKGGTVPGQFLPAVEKGVQQAMQSGAIAGYAMQDIRVTVHDGKHHPVDSKEIAFVTAGRKAFLDAVAKAHALVLEPIVEIDVSIPESHVGDVTGGLAAKRARILGTDARRDGTLVISAQVPLAELADYSTELKSMTAGEGRFAMDLSHYEAVPAPVQKKLREAWKPQHDDA